MGWVTGARQQKVFSIHLVSNRLGPDTLLKANSANPVRTCLLGICTPFSAVETEVEKGAKTHFHPPNSEAQLTKPW